MFPHTVLESDDENKILPPDWVSPTTTGSSVAGGTANLKTDEEIRAAVKASRLVPRWTSSEANYNLRAIKCSARVTLLKP